MSRILATYRTPRGGVELVLVCDSEAVEGYAPHGGDVYGGALPRYHVEEYTSGELVGEHVYTALDDAAAIERLADRVAAGVYTATGAKNPPALVVAGEGARS
jgi:hypothetical protein